MHPMNQVSSRGSKVILIGGPTASGKSQLAMALSKYFPITIINADSMQMYKGLPILTAFPDEQDFFSVPHVVYGAWAPTHQGSVAMWQVECFSAIQHAIQDNRIPVVVGGTGLYFKALIEGIHHMPDIPAEVRSNAVFNQKTLGQEEFYRQLIHLDPLVGNKIKPGDRYRSLRAWEVLKFTGKSIFSWHTSEKGIVDHPCYTWISVVVLPERDILYERCNQRWDLMIQKGVVREVEEFLNIPEHHNSPLCNAVGVQEIKRYMAGDLSPEDMMDQVKRRTRQYAKRQTTWFRHQFPWRDAHRLSGANELDVTQLVHIF